MSGAYGSHDSGAILTTIVVYDYDSRMRLSLRCGGLKGVYVQKIDIFKELTQNFRTYELRGQGKKNDQNQDKQAPHTILQKLSPKVTYTPLRFLPRLDQPCFGPKNNVAQINFWILPINAESLEMQKLIFGFDVCVRRMVFYGVAMFDL